MKHRILLALLILILAGCVPGVTPEPPVGPTQGIPETVVSKVTSSPTPEILRQTPTLPVTPAQYPTNGYGPANFPADIDPLTGLAVKNPEILERRPLVVKVENIPRGDRPQFGLSAADHIYEYYTEEGATRFAAIYYGQDASQVAPIRSARFFDVNLIRMYKAVFAFGSAYEGVLKRLYDSEFKDRLVVEGARNCPPMCRYDPNGHNFLTTDTQKLSAYISQQGVNNDRQSLDGLSFQESIPQKGTSAQQIFVRYSGAIYNRWDYDDTQQVYLRWVDKADDSNRNNEVYVQLTDRANQQPITADNVVVLFMDHQYIVKPPHEVVDMVFSGSGEAVAFRDGQAFRLTWHRLSSDSLVILTYPDQKTPYALKPGNTWFEILGKTSSIQDQSPIWRFVFSIP